MSLAMILVVTLIATLAVCVFTIGYNSYVYGKAVLFNKKDKTTYFNSIFGHVTNILDGSTSLRYLATAALTNGDLALNINSSHFGSTVLLKPFMAYLKANNIEWQEISKAKDEQTDEDGTRLVKGVLILGESRVGIAMRVVKYNMSGQNKHIMSADKSPVPAEYMEADGECWVITRLATANYNGEGEEKLDKLVEYYQQYSVQTDYSRRIAANVNLRMLKAHMGSMAVSATYMRRTFNAVHCSVYNVWGTLNGVTGKINLAAFLDKAADIMTAVEGNYIFTGIPGTGKTSFMLQLYAKLVDAGIQTYFLSQLQPAHFENILKFISEQYVVDEEESLDELLSGEEAAKEELLVILVDEAAMNALSDGELRQLKTLLDGPLTKTGKKIRFVLSTNTRFADIDPALTREGRTVGVFEFRETKLVDMVEAYNADLITLGKKVPTPEMEELIAALEETDETTMPLGKFLQGFVAPGVYVDINDVVTTE